MKTYIILLRGINVSGKNKILMQDLCDVLTSLRYQKVQTYIQSGNIILDAKDEKGKVANKIKQAILKHFGYHVPVIIRTVEEWENVLTQNPYIAKEEKKVAFVFLDAISKETVSNVNTNDDKFTVAGDVVYIYCKNGFGKTKLTNNFFEKKLKVTATTRNFRTTKKLMELANK